MKKSLNHYDFLGVPESASDEEIERAIIRFEDPAHALAYADPERNDGLYDLLIRMRVDLLSGPVRRQAYERSVHLGTMPVSDSIGGANLSSKSWQAPPNDRAEKGSAPTPTRVRGPLAGMVLVLLLTATVAVGVQRANSFSQAQPPAVSLFMSGSPGNRPIGSDSVVHLDWTSVKGAEAYQVQIATRESGNAFHVLRSVKTGRTFYDMRVLGRRMYEWRVRAGGRGKWAPYTVWDAFSVPAPAIGVPARLHAVVEHSGSRQIARMCWSRVHAARAYILHVRGGQRRTVRGTCASLTVRPGLYAWTVAAQVLAAQLYTGPHSRMDRFVVVHPRHRNHRRHRSTSRGHNSAPSSGRQTPSQQILVAVALPLPAAPAVTTGSSSGPSASSAHMTTVSETASRSAPRHTATRHAVQGSRFRSAARSPVHAMPTAVRLPVRHVIVAAAVSSHRSAKHSGSTYIPPHLHRLRSRPPHVCRAPFLPRPRRHRFRRATRSIGSPSRLPGCSVYWVAP